MALRAAALSGTLLLLAAPQTPLASRRDVTLGDVVRNLTAADGADLTAAEHRQLASSVHGLQRQLAALQDQLAATQWAADACPDGWTRHKRSCYLLPSVTATWFGANVLCPAIDRRARLASVHTDNHQFVKELVAATQEAEYVWLGGSRLKSGGTDWGWQDGTPFDYENWAPGQPNNQGEDCACLQGPKSGYAAQPGELHDGPCSTGFVANLLCQIPIA